MREGLLKLHTHHLLITQGLDPAQLGSQQRDAETGMVAQIKLHRGTAQQRLGGLQQQGQATPAEVKEIRLQPAVSRHD